MTLNETWKNCLAMWKWIAEQIRAGSKESVVDLKEQWLSEHGFKADTIRLDCFFCEYAEDNCPTCPGALVEPSFRCDNPDYEYYDEPIKFYEKLVALNKERIA